jgi:hypothetical protein
MDLQKKKTEPQVGEDDNGFFHGNIHFYFSDGKSTRLMFVSSWVANDLDIMNIAYSPETKVLKPYKDGPSFNLNNALNSPEKLMEKVQDIPEHPYVRLPDPCNPHCSASDCFVNIRF